MKHILIAIALALYAASAYAACVTQTYIVDGRMVVCTVCCDAAGNCITSCL